MSKHIAPEHRAAGEPLSHRAVGHGAAPGHSPQSGRGASATTIERQLYRARFLASMAEQAIIASDVHAFASSAARSTSEALGAAAVGLYLCDVCGVPKLFAGSGLPADWRGLGGLSASASDAGSAMPSGDAERLLRADLSRIGFRATMFGRVRTAAGGTGLLGIHSATPRRFDPDEAEFASSVARVLGYALDRAAREDDMARRTALDLNAGGARSELLANLARITDGFFALDEAWRFTFVNPATAQLLRITPMELLGHTIWSVFSPGVAGQLDAAFRWCLEHQERRALAVEIPALNAWFELRAYPSPRGLSVYFRDVTAERHTSAEQLRLHKNARAVAEISRVLARELEVSDVLHSVLHESIQVLGATSAAVWSADPRRQTLSMLAQKNLGTAAAARLHQLSYAAPIPTATAARTLEVQSAEVGPISLEVLGEHASVLAIPLVHGRALMGVMSAFWSQPRHFSDADVGFYTTVGGVFAVALHNARLFEDLHTALRLRKEFIAGAAHELKTPLTSINLRLHLLGRTPLVGHQRDDLQALQHQVNRITRLVESLLSVAALDRPPRGNLEPLQLTSVVQRAIENVWTRVETRPVAVLDASVVVVADRGQVTDICEHLMENAARYAPPGTEITVRVDQVGGEALVSFQDRGVGISAERQPYVFEPFYQLVPPGRSGYTGAVSLGLHLAKRLVEAMGGRIGFQSTPGGGSTFWFALPARVEGPRPAAATST